MTLQHLDIWRAVDALAAQHNLSPSGLALKAGLSATAFNPTKRKANGRKRWPSTESIARILKATGSSLTDFTALANRGEAAPTALPLLSLTKAAQTGYVTTNGLTAARTGTQFRFPALPRDAFAVEIIGDVFAPAYRAGAILLLAPQPAPRRQDRVALQTAGGAVRLGTLLRRTARTITLLDFAAPAKPVTLPTTNITWMHRILWASQ